MDDNNSSLGRGLESLIPSSVPRSDSPVTPPTSLPSSANMPAEPFSPSVPSAPAPANQPEPPRPRPEKERGPKFAEAIYHIEVDKVRPNPEQPRRNFNQEGIKELAASIREFGLLQPIIVRKIEREVPTGTQVEYELISGERRLMAVKTLGMELVPAMIRNVGLEREKLELAVVENIQRENLNPVEMARALTRLKDEFRMTQREIAMRLGKSREVVANTMRLLDLPSVIQEALQRNQITESHGRLLLTVAEPVLREKLFRDLLERHLTTRELKNRVRATKPKPEPAHAPLSPELKMLQEKLSSELGAPVKIEQERDTADDGGGSGGLTAGKITISFYSDEELKNIIHRLSKDES
ncbi:MAG: ParB/RepB/Spo0J family partition protein [Patescibacteria group bacterium]